MAPKCADDKEIIKKYDKFSTKIYDWIQKRKDREELTTAIYLYSYISRKPNREGK